MGWNLADSCHTRQHNYQAILLHTTRDEMLDMDVQQNSVMDNFPLAMANINIVNKPLILHQLEYLQKYGIHDILITVEKKFAHKIEKYLKNDFKSSDPKANIDLVVFQEEEEPVVVL